MKFERIPLGAQEPYGLTPTEKLVVNQAVEAREDALNIATGGGVGAAVLTRKGQVFTGATLALAIPSALCAERVAVAHAHACHALDIVAVAIARKDGDLIMPCGQCLQLLSDIQTYARTRITVYSVDIGRQVVQRVALTELLPYPFTSRKLNQAAYANAPQAGGIL